MNKAEDIEQLIYRELPPDRYCYIHNFIVEKDKEIERLKKDNEYLNKKHEKIIHNIMEFVDKNTFNHRNTGERILTLHGKGILDLLDICLGSDKEW